GGKSRLVCPADFAYGDQGWPPLIKPGATLVFEVELLGIAQPSAHIAPRSEQTPPWYYCDETRSYYPYVRECASGWRQVAPPATPPGKYPRAARWRCLPGIELAVDTRLGRRRQGPAAQLARAGASERWLCPPRSPMAPLIRLGSRQWP